MLNACEAPAYLRRDVHLRAMEGLQKGVKALDVLEDWLKAPPSETMTVGELMLKCGITKREAPAVGGSFVIVVEVVLDDSAAFAAVADSPAALGGRAVFPRRRGLLNGCRAYSR